MLALAHPVIAAERPTGSITQYMNGMQISNSDLIVGKPVTIKAPDGKMTYNQGWTIYNNSVNDGVEHDIEFELQKNFGFNTFEKRYCVTARDLAPFGIKGKMDLWIGEFTIKPGYPVGLNTNRTNFVPTTQLNSKFTKVCTEWTTVKDAPKVGEQRLAIVGGAVVTHGALQIQSVSIESR